MTWKALIEKDPNVLCNPDLRPQTTERELKKLGTLEQKIVGSTVAASWTQILGFALYALVLYIFIFIFKLDQLAADNIADFPRIIEVFQSLSDNALIVVMFLVGASVFGAVGKYAAAINVHYNLADAIGTFILHISSMTCRNKVNKEICMTYYEFPNDCWQNDLKRQPVRYIRKRKAIRLLEDIQDIMRALAFAFKHNARTQTSRSRFETNTSADVDLEDSQVDPRKLPMMEHLIAEVFVQDTDYLTALLTMASLRVKLLMEHGVLYGAFEAPMVHINAVGTQVATISALQVLGLFPSLADLFFLSLCIVFVLLPFPLWMTYGFFGLAIYYLELLFILSLYGFGRKVGNPYNRFDDSPFTFHDLGGLTRDIASNVDNQMDTLIGEAIAFRDSKILCEKEDTKLPPQSKSRQIRSILDDQSDGIYSDSDYNVV